MADGGLSRQVGLRAGRGDRCDGRARFDPVWRGAASRAGRLPGGSWRASGLAGGLALLLLACGQSPQQSQTGQQPQATPSAPSQPAGQRREQLLVLTSVFPITALTQAVAAGCARVEPLVPASVSPHDYQASPGDLLKLRQARILVVNGLGLEEFLEPLIRNAENPGLTRIDSSRGIATLASPPPGRGGHGHDLDHHAGTGNSSSSNDPSHSHSAGGVNPHIWLDPRRAEQQLTTIRDGLIRADPGCAPTYRRNAEAYGRQLRQLDGQLAAQLAPARGKTFVVPHDFAPYLAQRYGLQAAALVDLPEQSPGSSSVQRLQRIAKSQGLRALLSESAQPPRTLAALAEDLRLPVLRLDPLETGPADVRQAPAHFLAALRRNGAVLRQVFGLQPAS